MNSTIVKKLPSGWLTTGLLATTSLFGLGISPAEAASFGQVVVANRNSGNISVINVETDKLFKTVALPFSLGDLLPEPMYVVHLPETGEVAVGDRANDRIVFFDEKDYSVTGTVAAGDGIFHMWADPLGEQLWVNNDIDNTISVIDPELQSVLTTINIPADLVADGGKPHDVILDPTGDYAYVSILGFSDSSDAVVKFSTDTFLEVDRAFVGQDAHLSLTAANNFLYVPAQDSNRVDILDRMTLDLVTTIDVPGAHGAGMTPDGQTFFTTNLPGGGTDGLFAIDTTTNTIVPGTPIDTGDPGDLLPVPHNVVVTGNGEKLYVTHSGGTSSSVSVYSLDGQIPTFEDSITVDGTNPFGIAFVDVTVPETSGGLGLLAFGLIGAGTAIQKKRKQSL